MIVSLFQKEQIQWYYTFKKVYIYMCLFNLLNKKDTSRSILNHRLPRHRLDAGTFGIFFWLK